MRIQVPYWSFNVLQMTLPRVSRGTVLYASHVLGDAFVSALRNAPQSRFAEEGDEKAEGLNPRVFRTQTRQAFANSVAELIEKHKLPVARREFAAALKKDGVKPEEMTEIIAQVKKFVNIKNADDSEKTINSAGDQFRDWLVEEHNGASKTKVSAETGESGKNLVNWARAAKGGYAGAFIKLLSDAAFSAAQRFNIDADEFEDELASNYVIEALEQKNQIENSPFIGSYLGWIANHLYKRGLRGIPKSTHSVTNKTRQKTTLDTPMKGEDDDMDSGSSQVTEEAIGRAHDLDVDDPEVGEMIDELMKQIRKNEPEHKDGIIRLLEHLIETRTWSIQSDIVKDDPQFAEDIMDANPSYVKKGGKKGWLQRYSNLTPEKQKWKFEIDARTYLDKYLFPKLIIEITKYMKKANNPELNITMKRWIDEMRESKHKSEALEWIEETPRTTYQPEQMLVPSEEGEPENKLVTKRRFRMLDRPGRQSHVAELGRMTFVAAVSDKKSSLSAQLLRIAASQDDVELVGELIENNENRGAVRVFMRGENRFAHVLRYSVVAGAPQFDVPYDVDREHVLEALKVAKETASSVSSAV